MILEIYENKYHDNMLEIVEKLVCDGKSVIVLPSWKDSEANTIFAGDFEIRCNWEDVGE